MPRSLDGSLQDQVEDEDILSVLSGHRAVHQVAEEINRKVANKVVVGLGLCLALYDITDIGKSFVFPGDSATHTKVLLWIFRIFMEEHAFMNDNSSDPVLKVLCH